MFSLVGVLVVVMAVLAAIETVVPLHARGRWHRVHLGPNLALTLLTFATNLLFNGALVLALSSLPAHAGLLRGAALPAWLDLSLVVLGLDLATYLAHRAMHASAFLWRFHAVHHADPTVDVTTTVRQHPGESVLRYVFLAAAALGLGAGPDAFAVYRVWSALNGLFEHANVRVPTRLDTLLSLVVVTPNMHKVHHSRRALETNSNYGNVVSLFDRLFATFIPSRQGVQVAYGLAGHDDPAGQTTGALLALPFRTRPVAAAVQEVSA